MRSVNMGVIELPDDVVIYPDGETYTGDGSEDWIKKDPRSEDFALLS